MQTTEEIKEEVKNLQQIQSGDILLMPDGKKVIIVSVSGNTVEMRHDDIFHPTRHKNIIRFPCDGEESLVPTVASTSIKVIRKA